MLHYYPVSNSGQQVKLLITGWLTHGFSQFVKNKKDFEMFQQISLSKIHKNDCHTNIVVSKCPCNICALWLPLTYGGQVIYKYVGGWGHRWLRYLLASYAAPKSKSVLISRQLILYTEHVLPILLPELFLR